MLGDILRAVQRRILKSAARGYVALTEPRREAIQDNRQEQGRGETSTPAKKASPRRIQEQKARSSATATKRVTPSKQTTPTEPPSSRTRKTPSSKTTPKRSPSSPATTEAELHPAKRRGRPKKSESLTPQTLMAGHLQASGDELGAAQVIQQEQTLRAAEALVAEHAAETPEPPKTRVRKRRSAKKPPEVSSEGAEKAKRPSGRKRAPRKKAERSAGQEDIAPPAEASEGETGIGATGQEAVTQEE